MPPDPDSAGSAYPIPSWVLTGTSPAPESQQEPPEEEPPDSDEEIFRSVGIDPEKGMASPTYQKVKKLFGSGFNLPIGTNIDKKVWSDPNRRAWWGDLAPLGWGALEVGLSAASRLQHLQGAMGLDPEDTPYVDAFTRFMNKQYDRMEGKETSGKKLMHWTGGALALGEIPGAEVGGGALGGAEAGFFSPTYETKPEDYWRTALLQTGLGALALGVGSNQLGRYAGKKIPGLLGQEARTVAAEAGLPELGGAVEAGGAEAGGAAQEVEESFNPFEEVPRKAYEITVDPDIGIASPYQAAKAMLEPNTRMDATVVEGLRRMMMARTGGLQQADPRGAIPGQFSFPRSTTSLAPEVVHWLMNSEPGQAFLHQAATLDPASPGIAKLLAAAYSAAVKPKLPGPVTINPDITAPEGGMYGRMRSNTLRSLGYEP